MSWGVCVVWGPLTAPCFSPMLLSDPQRYSQDESWIFGAAAKGDRGKAWQSAVVTTRLQAVSAGSAPAAALQLVRLPSDVSVRLLCCSSAGQTLWNGGNVVLQMQRHPRPQVPSISENRNPSLTSIKDTDPLTVAAALCLWWPDLC